MTKKDIKAFVNSRFIEACDYIIRAYGFKSDAKFAESIETHSKILSDIRVGKLNAGTDIMSILLLKYPEINGTWILTGKEDMLISSKKIPDKPDIKEYIDNQIKKAFQDLEGFRASEG